jgi:hypothetical protein
VKWSKPTKLNPNCQSMYMKIAMAKNGSESVVFLLTSTATPYLRDALDLMFYPSQLNYRFRYDKKWLSKNFKLADGGISKSVIQELVGKKAILVHILTEKEDQQYKILEFLPLREATIHEVKILGGFLWLGFTLGDWIVYHQESTDSKVNEHHETFRRQTPENSRDQVEELVFLVNDFKVETIPDDPTGENEEVLSNWTRLAGHMSRFGLRCSKKTLIFMKLVSLKSIEAKKALSAKPLDSKERGFTFEAGKSYSFNIAEYCGTNIEPFEMKLKTQIDKITPTVEKAEVRGKYDMLNFLINCKPAQKESISAILFEPSNAKDYLITKALLKVKIKTGKWRTLWFPLLLFGFSTFVTSEQFLKLIAGEAASYGILVVGAIGTILSTISLLFLRH